MAPGHHRPLCPPSRGAPRLTPNECARGILGKPMKSVVRRTKSRLARRLCRLAQRKKRKQNHHQQRKLQQAPVSRQHHQPPQQEKAFMLPVSRHTIHLNIQQKLYTIPTIVIVTSSAYTYTSSAGEPAQRRAALGLCPLAACEGVVVKPRWARR